MQCPLTLYKQKYHCKPFKESHLNRKQCNLRKKGRHCKEYISRNLQRNLHNNKCSHNLMRVAHKTITFTMNSSDKLPLPITTSWTLQRVAGFFFFNTRCRKRKFILLQASNPRKKTPTKYSNKRGKKEKKVHCLHLIAKKAHDYLKDCCKEWHKKKPSKTRCHRRQFIPLQTSNPRKKNTPNQVLKNKEKKKGGESNSLTLLRRRWWVSSVS